MHILGGILMRKICTNTISKAQQAFLKQLTDITITATLDSPYSISYRMLSDICKKQFDIDFYDAFDIIHEQTKKGGLNVFEQAIKNVSPLVELKSKRVGGANYQVPVPVAGERRTTLAFRWIKAAINTKKGKRMAEKLALELIDASNKTGAAMKKREDVHRMAEANKAFAHFA